jgi:hypothetical protein
MSNVTLDYPHVRAAELCPLCGKPKNPDDRLIVCWYCWRSAHGRDGFTPLARRMIEARERELTPIRCYCGRMSCQICARSRKRSKTRGVTATCPKIEESKMKFEHKGITIQVNERGRFWFADADGKVSTHETLELAQKAVDAMVAATRRSGTSEMNCPKCGAPMEPRKTKARGLLMARGCGPDRTIRIEVCLSCDYIVLPDFENPDAAGCIFEHFRE